MQKALVVDMILKAEHVSKTIKGAQILKDINLELTGGTVYGFTGRNGSGKTMLFRALSGLMRVTEGAVTLDGKTLGKDFSVLPSLGIVLENVGLFTNMTGKENLKYLVGLTGSVGDKEVKYALERVGLDPEDKRTYRKYSLGMKQRLAIAQAVMESPDVIMLDEPTNGLDDSGVEFIRKLIMEEKKRGAIVLLASHNRDDIRLLADKLYHIEFGELTELEAMI